MGHRSQARLARAGGKALNATKRGLGTDVEHRFDAIERDAIERELDDQGCAVVDGLLSPAECDGLVSLYESAA